MICDEFHHRFLRRKFRVNKRSQLRESIKKFLEGHVRLVSISLTEEKIDASRRENRTNDTCVYEQFSELARLEVGDVLAIAKGSVEVEDCLELLLER